MTPEMTPAEYAVAYQARRIIEELTCPGLSADCSLDSIRRTVLARLQSAHLFLKLAEAGAENHGPAQPDEPGAERYCGWCGNANQDELEWDSDDETVRLTGDSAAAIPAWFCTMLAACIARRRARYPSRRTPELQRAREFLALAASQAEPVIVGLAAFVAATRQAREREAMLALTQPRRHAQGRPAMPSREQYQAAQWAHTLRNPANRTAYQRQ